ncbi:hypothetical protein [Staphylococcus americanisciuri]|uniref:Uncharacterized protein n=1 Tax=Staphylococcus americanisciuri TaxID=2973940 RepID=A0ABT2F1A3_9STAP|nr:hypothetical protein [Staphylococcus americanisciuri]MCS4486149.1 hypothetical protein [Staphylococcus americanisciuri]
MKTYHYKDNFWDASSKEMPIYNEQGEHVMMLRVLHKKNARNVKKFLSSIKQEYEVTDGKDLYYVHRQKSFRSYFCPIWEVYHNHQLIGEFKVKMSFWRQRLCYIPSQGETLSWQMGVLSHSMTVTDERDVEVLKSKSSYFKIRTEHTLSLNPESYPAMLLILLFHVAFEYHEMTQNAAASGGAT